MARTGVAALYVAVVLAVFEIGSCTRCYQCSSETDKRCGDPFTPSAFTPVDCTSPAIEDFNKQNLMYVLRQGQQGALMSTAGAPKFCQKIVTKTGSVVRTCVDGHPGDTNFVCKAVDNTVTKYCGVCEKDLCNGAGGISLSMPMGILALVASYIFYTQ